MRFAYVSATGKKLFSVLKEAAENAVKRYYVPVQ